MRVAFLMCVLSLCACIPAFAQEQTITGKITDGVSGEPLPGVNIVIKGTNRGTATDKNGEYALTAPSSAVLVFTFVGFKAVEKPVGSVSSIDIAMTEDVIRLGEGVVVTGLGIEREKRSLGYSISEVSGKDVTVARESNILNALQGKVTGVLITQTGGGLGGSSQVFIRGVTSLSGNNNPLWVVDGVPIFNEQTSLGSRTDGNRDFFNGAAVVNPDDIESINVLKGAAAAALYGSRAAAGVILVTTKKGSVRKDGLTRPQIEINSSTRFDWLFRTPSMQYEYAGGYSGKYDSSEVYWAWGPAIRGQTVTLPALFRRGPLRAYKENYNDFYKIGKTLDNSISISDANSKFDYRLGVTSLNQEGILPNSELNRITLSLNAGVKHAEWMTTRFSVQYIRTDVPNRGVAGLNDNNVISWNQFLPTTNFRWFRPWKNALGEQLSPLGSATSGRLNNPLWIRYENKNGDLNNRVIASLTQVFTPIDGLNITSRIGYDFEKDKRIFNGSPGTIGSQAGWFNVASIHRRQFNWDGIVSYERIVGPKKEVLLKGLAGFNYNSRIFELEGGYSYGPSSGSALNPSASQNNTPSRDYSDVRLMGAYAQLEAGYKGWLNLTISARNDWSSTLPKSNNSYFYPSVSAAFVFTDAFHIPWKGLSFGKLRASWAQVGNTADPYGLNFLYYPQPSTFGEYGLSIFFPFRDQRALAKTGILPNNDLKSEQQNSWEVGAELAFLDGRISIDVVYYSKETHNQIFNRPIPVSNGFFNALVNSGSTVNVGIEATLRATVLDVKNFRWNATINFYTQKTTVHNLGVKQQVTNTAFNGVQVAAIEGGSLELQGIGWQREPTTGRPLIDPRNGRRIAGGTKSFGSIYPGAVWGFTNVFSIAKGLTLSMTIDGRVGGKLYSGTIEGLWNGGLTTETAENRKGTYIDRSGVIIDENGVVRDNDVPVRNTQSLWNTLSNNNTGEPFVFDGTFIKLREVGLFYNLPEKWLKRTPFTGVRVGIEGRHLLLIYSKVPHIDPEVNLFGGGSGGFGVEYNNIPSSRSLGFNINMRF